MLRRIAAAVITAASLSAIAGVIAGLGEAIYIVAADAADGAPSAADAGVALAVVPLVVVAALVVGPPALSLASGLGRIPALRAWRADLGQPGERRVAALTGAAVVLAAAAAFAVATFTVAAWTHAHFHAPRAIALLEAGALTAIAAALVVGAVAAGPPLAARLAALGALRRATSGRRAVVVAAVLVAAGVAAGWFAIARAVPAAELGPACAGLALALALAALRWLRIGRRLDLRRALAVALAGVAIAAAGLATIARLDDARATVAARGLVSRAALAALWRLDDGDGDGFAARFGGGDCDDGDRRVHPGAREVPGNRADENCTGGDLTAADLRHRLEPHPSAYAVTGAAHGARNVILLTVDALRADHVGAYGYPRPTSPRLDALAARATRFEWAISPSPTTRRAIPAMMTARYASSLSWQRIEWVRLQAGAHPLISESFQRAGYATRAIHCCVVLFDKPHGMTAGFDEVDASAERLGRQRGYSADQVAARIVDFLAERRDDPRPFFLWSHIIDPHDPHGVIPGAPRFGDRDVDRYDAEIAFVDAQIGAVLDALEHSGLADRTIVAVTADHGEEFGEHGNRFHGRSVYNEVMRVPLVIFDPGAPPSVVRQPVSLIDVGPTLLDLAGVARPAGQNGVSLAAAVRDGAAPPARTVLGELIADYSIKRNLVAAWVYPWKVVWDLDADTYELYSLTADPGDATDRRRSEPAALRVAVRALHDAMDRELSRLPTDREAPDRAAAPDREAAR